MYPPTTSKVAAKPSKVARIGRDVPVDLADMMGVYQRDRLIGKGQIPGMMWLGLVSGGRSINVCDVPIGAPADGFSEPGFIGMLICSFGDRP